MDTLIQTLLEMKEQKHFMDSADYLIREMGYRLTYQDQDRDLEIRRAAFHTFQERTHHSQLASLPTMRRWFGINGSAQPRREQIFQLGFAMGLTREKTQEYLVQAIHQPAFQVNDYQEVILCYGLEQGISYEECQEMMDAFEEQMQEDFIFLQTSRTSRMMGQFLQQKEQSKEDFLRWMFDNARLFKGYSKTTLNYLNKYKKIICDYIRKDVRKQLAYLLAETEYASWCGQNVLDQMTVRERINTYIYQQQHRHPIGISEDLAANILELTRIAYSDADTNSLLLSELYPVKRSGDRKEYREIVSMTDKHLSDLLHIDVIKEHLTQVYRAWHQLEDATTVEQAEIPEWIRRLIQEYSRGKVTVVDRDNAAEWLERYIADNRRRCLQVQRGDLLPMILYVACRQYEDQQIDEWDGYSQKLARAYFTRLANDTLNACNMSPINEDYELDAVLLACFQQEDMYSYSDVMEALNEI